jgi:TldD protein
VKLAGAAGMAAATTGWDAVLADQAQAAPGPDAAERDLVLLALDAARSAGASYADARITRGNTESIATRERQITGVSKTETYGIGVRARVGGSWGFAATRDLTKDAVATARSTPRRCGGQHFHQPREVASGPSGQSAGRPMDHAPPNRSVHGAHRGESRAALQDQ